MIFVTVGTDMPFNRFVRVVDEWARETHRTDVFAQIGETDWQPTHIEYRKFLEPLEFTQRFAEAAVIVAHAGMGTILSALHLGKPILIMPRRASLGEQRNEHQLATARQLREMGKVEVALDESELQSKLARIDHLPAAAPIRGTADDGLIAAVRGFIHHRS